MKKLSGRRRGAVLIAKDVLLALKDKVLTPAHCYIAINNRYLGKAVDRDWSGKEVQKFFNRKAKVKLKNCDVCALGAMFVSAIRKFDNVNGESFHASGLVGRHVSRDEIVKRLAPFFTRMELGEIENAYEDWNPYGNNINDDKKRMAVIMENIIKNDGKFRKAGFDKEVEAV